MTSMASQRALDYLEQLPGTTFTKLYQQPSTALAIFRRMLPHLAKTIVMAMLYMPSPLPESQLNSWIKPDHDSAQARERSISVLMRLKIMYERHDPKGPYGYELSDGFAKSLRLALTGGGDHRSFGVPAHDSCREDVTISFLDVHARHQWDGILYYIVGAAGTGLNKKIALGPGTIRLLNQGKFVDRSQGMLRITQEGFAFLLQEVNGQVWNLLIVYLTFAHEERKSLEASYVVSRLCSVSALLRYLPQ